MVALARLRFLRGSAQKARLVVDTIRGRPVGEALAILRASRRAAARDVAKLLRSAVDNAKQKQEGIDVDRLFVSRAFVDGAPMMKRIRPRAQGRAFRILKRSCHMTIEVDLRAPGRAPAAPAA
ncbi:MAG: 50S ribosomal protein L22 [Acidobacteria bacterium]|nr:50S ribosomal protein L22 [Acidobacteriota bacterium]